MCAQQVLDANRVAVFSDSIFLLDVLSSLIGFTSTLAMGATCVQRTK